MPKPLLYLLSLLAALALGLTLTAPTGSAATPTPPGGAGGAGSSVKLHSLAQLADRGQKKVCPRCDSIALTTKHGSSRLLASAKPQGYGPADLARAYHLPAATTGSKATIAIIDAGVDPNLESDLAVYRKQYGLPACTQANGCLRLLDYEGKQQPTPPTDPDGKHFNQDVALETSLDMDAASAACPTCKLVEVSTPWQDSVSDNDVSTGDFARAVDRAVRAGATAISISYGYTADRFNTSGSVLKSLSRKGVSVFASTGDGGFNGAIHQAWPSNLPQVVAVGGTTLHTNGSQDAWADAGSGCETRFAAATGQPKAVAALCGGHRAASDISADADPETGFAVYDSYAPYDGQAPKWTVVGGTSASAPYIAGLTARAGHAAQQNGPAALYDAPQGSLTDVTSGTPNGDCGDAERAVANRVCQAGSGWDGPTGVGTPFGLSVFGGPAAARV